MTARECIYLINLKYSVVNAVNTIQNYYNTGNVSATGTDTTHLGSIVGYNREYYETVVQRNYYLTGTAATGIGGVTDDSAKVQAKSSNDMKLNTFVTLLNTGFEDLPWTHVSNSYPKLSWQQ